MPRLGLFASVILVLFFGPFASGSETASSPEEGVLVYRDDTESVSVWLTARLILHAAAYFEGENELASGVEIRQGRLGFKAKLADHWSAELEADFSDDEAEVKDAWLAYTGFQSSLIKIGHHKEPMSLEELTSSKYITFVERALPNVFAPGRHLGVSYTAWTDRWHAAAGVFGGEAGDVDETGEDEGYGASARFVVTPVRREGRVVHLGLSGTLRTPDAGSDDRVRFRTRPETHVNRGRFLNTGRIRDVDQYSVLGLEAALQSNSFLFQTEYLMSEVDRIGTADPAFDGWYAFASWFVTGDSRPYRGDSAEFGKLTPLSSRGAVELAVRFSTVDLTDLEAGIEGGSTDILTFGVNYYLNERVRFMLNVSSVDQDRFADGDGDFLPMDSFEMIQARVQFNL